MKTDTCYLINQNLSTAAQDIQRAPERYQEVFANLSRCAGLALPEKPELRSVGYELGVGCGGIGLGMVFIVIAVVSAFSQWENLSVALCAASVGIGSIISLGHPHLMDAYLLTSHARYTDSVLQHLIAAGQIIDGEIVSAQVDESVQTITYRMIDPAGNQTIEDIYVTSVTKLFPVGGRVAVLYLNRYAKILL